MPMCFDCNFLETSVQIIKNKFWGMWAKLDRGFTKKKKKPFEKNSEKEEEMNRN